MEANNYMVISGRPKSGKTWLAERLAEQMRTIDTIKHYAMWVGMAMECRARGNRRMMRIAAKQAVTLLRSIEQRFAD